MVGQRAVDSGSVSTAWALTPQEEWKKEIAEQNRHYAQVMPC